MQCPKCQTQNTPGALSCSRCRNPLTAYGANDMEASDGTLSGLIPYKNAPALTAYYMGLFSIIPILGIPLGIAAVVLGVIGLNKLKNQPSAKGKVHAFVGIGCGALGALGWIGLFGLPIIASMLSS